MKEIVWSSVVKALSGKRFFNGIKVFSSLLLSRIMKKNILWGVPFVVNIEPTVHCNLRCPQCITGLGKIKRDRASLSFKNYKHFIDEFGEKIWYLLLYNQGEPFLNDHLIDFIKFAKQKRIYVTTSTNGHFLSDTRSTEKLIKSGLDSIFISIDGINQATYEKYRRGGNFQKVIEGIKVLVKCREKLKSKTPKIIIQFLVMKHNEHQIEKIKKLKQKIGADRLLIKTMQLENPIDADIFLPRAKKYNRYRSGKNNIEMKKPKNQLCNRLWYSTVILSDGRVVPCCFDKNGKYFFGEISQQTLNEIWKSDEYQKFRNKNRRARQSIDICQNCSQGQKIFF